MSTAKTPTLPYPHTHALTYASAVEPHRLETTALDGTMSTGQVTLFRRGVMLPLIERKVGVRET